MVVGMRPILRDYRRIAGTKWESNFGSGACRERTRKASWVSIYCVWSGPGTEVFHMRDQGRNMVSGGRPTVGASYLPDEE